MVEDCESILREFLKEPPTTADRDGEQHCFYCFAWFEYEKHDGDCLWLRAKALAPDNTLRSPSSTERAG